MDKNQLFIYFFNHFIIKLKMSLNGTGEITLI